MQYSEKFKQQLVGKVLGPQGLSLSKVARDSGVSVSSLCKWRREAKTTGMTDNPKVAKRWTSAEKLRVLLEATAAGASGRGELLRREGLHEADLERFQAEALEGMQSLHAKRDPADKKRIKELERELRRKDKALAEAAALIVLSKKVQAYFGAAEVGDTDKESE